MGRTVPPSGLKAVAEQVKEESMKPVEKKAQTRASISTGLALLNCACANNAETGYQPGTIVNIIGGSHSGKSILALSCLAEAAINPKLSEYRLIYDDAESANSFDMRGMFGQTLVDRLEPPPGLDEDYPMSTTVEEFQDNVLRLIDAGRPFIYVLDSLDALSSEDEQDYVDASREAREKGKDTKGTYGGSKPKAMSALLRTIVSRLERTKSLVIIVSQVRDKMNAGPFEKKETVAGGRALEFYCSIRMWLKHVQTIKKGERVVGDRTKIDVSKNKYTGLRRQVEFIVYPSYGVDDIGSSVDWLLEEKHWSGGGGARINAEELGLEMKRAELLVAIEDGGLERKLRRVVERKWLEIEESMKLDRKPRF